MKKRPAATEYDRDIVSNANADRAAQYADRTGKCPVCQERPRRLGITCGDLRCIRKWLHIGDPSGFLEEESQ